MSFLLFSLSFLDGERKDNSIIVQKVIHPLSKKGIGANMNYLLGKKIILAFDQPLMKQLNQIPKLKIYFKTKLKQKAIHP